MRFQVLFAFLFACVFSASAFPLNFGKLKGKAPAIKRDSDAIIAYRQYKWLKRGSDKGHKSKGYSPSPTPNKPSQTYHPKPSKTYEAAHLTTKHHEHKPTAKPERTGLSTKTWA